jgi:hypothetical protein
MRTVSGVKTAIKSSLAYRSLMGAKAAIKLVGFSRRFGVEADPSAEGGPESSLPIDIVIPVVDKDADTLPFVIDSAREHVKHPIGSIYLVCPPDSDRVRRTAREKGCVAIDERELVPIAPKDIGYVSRGKDRSGWMYQQFLKWSGGKFCSNRHYLVADSDTVFASDQAFEIGGRMVFDFCDGIHRPYFDAYERIFGAKTRSPLSFTSHHSLIDVGIVDTMIGDIEKRHGVPWYKAIIDRIDASEKSSVSDYDNYGLYVFEKAPEKMRVRYWRNLSLYRQDLGMPDRLPSRIRGRYLTISFHAYNT